MQLPLQPFNYQGKQPTQQVHCVRELGCSAGQGIQCIQLSISSTDHVVIGTQPLCKSELFTIMKPCMIYGNRDIRNTVQKQIPVAAIKLSLCSKQCCHRNNKSLTEFLEVEEVPEGWLPDADVLAC